VAAAGQARNPQRRERVPLDDIDALHAELAAKRIPIDTGVADVFTEAVMKSTIVATALAVGVVIGYSGLAWTQTGQGMPVAGYGGARDVPGAHELPDPKMDYKVVFSVSQAAAKPGDINPTPQTMARYLNTLAKNGVPADHRHIAAVFHQGGTDSVLTNGAFKSRFNGQDNPNIALIHELKQAGVDFRVCGQALLGKKIEPAMVLPDIQVDLWAMTTMVNLQLRGYARIGS
jgi:intracellular sulfur oxidation DsrE/DsrF family protein